MATLAPAWPWHAYLGVCEHCVMRLGLITFPASKDEVLADMAMATDAGFDVLATGDHLRHPRDGGPPVLDGWSVLAAWAPMTTHVRLAMLVSNIIFRQPSVLAKQAVTVDRISEGRLDLGVGAGVYPTDHSMAGVPAWSPRERVDRLEEFVRALDRALRGDASFGGRYYRFDCAAVDPGALQHPRPPIVVGAVGPRMLRLTAQLADVWSAFGGNDVDDEQAFIAAIKQQTAVIDRCCDEIGRDPQSLRRSLVAYRPLQPWSSRDALARLIDNVRPLGFEEIILYKPASTDEQRVFDAFVADRLPGLGLR
jgi:alkanesulfonate monooxygenase SsuD/methylene tetrahydromethanopterin reductase-like flavin-dependent oxidoreductase (luciferase family)